LSGGVSAGNCNSTRAVNMSRALENLNFVLAHQKVDTFGQLGNDFTFALLRLVEIERDAGRDDAVFFRVFEFVKQIGRVQQGLGGNASPEQASAAEVLVLFNDCGLEP